MPGAASCPSRWPAQSGWTARQGSSDGPPANHPVLLEGPITSDCLDPEEQRHTPPSSSRGTSSSKCGVAAPRCACSALKKQPFYNLSQSSRFLPYPCNNAELLHHVICQLRRHIALTSLLSHDNSILISFWWQHRSGPSQCRVRNNRRPS